MASGFGEVALGDIRINGLNLFKVSFERVHTLSSLCWMVDLGIQFVSKTVADNGSKSVRDQLLSSLASRDQG